MLKRIVQIVNVKTVNVCNEKRIKLMNKIYLILALLFALSACSVGKKCVEQMRAMLYLVMFGFTKINQQNLIK